MNSRLSAAMLAALLVLCGSQQVVLAQRQAALPAGHDAEAAAPPPRPGRKIA